MVTDRGDPGNNWIFMVRCVIVWGRFGRRKQVQDLANILEQNVLQVINCIVAQLTPVFLTGNWTAAKRLFSSSTHPTWSSSFLWGTKFVWLNMIYSQLGYIFFCSSQSDTLSKRNKGIWWVFLYNLKTFSSRILSRSNCWYSVVFR